MMLLAVLSWAKRSRSNRPGKSVARGSFRRWKRMRYSFFSHSFCGLEPLLENSSLVRVMVCSWFSVNCLRLRLEDFPLRVECGLGRVGVGNGEHDQVAREGLVAAVIPPRDPRED